MSKSNSFTDLFFWKWSTAFQKAVSSIDLSDPDIQEGRYLLQKLRDVLFIEKLRLEGVPSHDFWVYVYIWLFNLPLRVNEFTIQQEGEAFMASEVDYLKKCLEVVLLCFKYIPQILIDLYTYYPRFNLKFEEIEFLYLDFWSQTPKVIDSLLVELGMRGISLLEPMPSSNRLEDLILPPKEVKEQEFNNLIINYFLGSTRDPVFKNILTEYLKARPQILEECTNLLLTQDLAVTDDFLAQAFIYNYMFWDVTQNTVGFCVANLKWYVVDDLSVTPDPFHEGRESFRREWESSSEAKRMEKVMLYKGYLEKARSCQAKTIEEKLADRKVREAERNLGLNPLSEVPVHAISSKESKEE